MNILTFYLEGSGWFFLEWKINVFIRDVSFLSF